MRRGIPPSVTPEAVETAHRDGFSCKTPVSYVYDANGYRRWCIDCGDELGEQAWHANGADVPSRVLGTIIAGFALVALLVITVLIGLRFTSDDDPGPRVTPTTYGPPPTCDKVAGC